MVSHSLIGFRRPVIRKYGGSSLATAESVRRVATGLATLVGTGGRAVVVVSAMGDATDRLVALATEFSDHPSRRELDQLLATGELVSAAVLAMALVRNGIAAVSLTGDQAGIQVDGEPGDGTIVRIDADRITERLRDNQIVVVAGFQGRDATGDVRTLGRGGSDTTAVAVAAALDVPECDIRTDVAGVRTADPRLVPDTQPVPDLASDVMLELSRHGAGVLHPRSVALAGREGVTVRVGHAVQPGPGTTVRPDAALLERGPQVVGIAHERGLRMLQVEGPCGRWAEVLARLAGEGLTPDVLSWPHPGHLRFTTRGRAPLPGDLGALTMDDALGSVSVIGTGLLDRPDSLAELLRVLGELVTAVPALTTSDTRLTAVLPENAVAAAVRALHTAFRLHLPAGDR